MTTEQRVITIDAAGRRLGRLASEIALLLNGKDSAAYAPNVVPNVRIEVANASRLVLTEAKKKGKIYEHYSGYFGGRKETTLEQLIATKGYSAAVEKAVYGMLPSNRLRREKMKRLHIHD